jgi:hypothetical protein
VYRRCRRHHDTGRRLLICSCLNGRSVSLDSTGVRYSSAYNRGASLVSCPAFTRQLSRTTCLTKFAASSLRTALCLPLIIGDNNNNNKSLTTNPSGNGTKRLLILLNHCLIMSDTGDSLLAFNGTSALHFNSAGLLQELVAVRDLLVLPCLGPPLRQARVSRIGKDALALILYTR